MFSRFFPHRLFRWYMLKQIFLAALVFAFLHITVFVWVEYGHFTDETREVVRSGIGLSYLFSLLTWLTVSFWMTWQLVVPLGRLIDKTVRMSQSPFTRNELKEDDLSFEEPGEWYDLERALNKLGRDLRNKTIRLSREKTELRAIMGAVSEAILAISSDKRPLFYNSQFAVMFGLQEFDASEIHIPQIIRSPDILQAYDRCLREGLPQRIETTIVTREDGEPVVFDVGVRPLRKKHNQEIYGAVALFHDISDIKKAEQIRIEFVGNVSHELRTPLTSIKGYMQTVLQDYQARRFDQCGEFLEIISKNVDRLGLLVSDLLDLSSLESGAQLTNNRISTRELTENVLTQINGRQHRIHLHFGVDHLRADAERVEQVLRNLVQNAVRYVPVGRNIDIYWDPSEDGGINLRVKDDGPGIPLKHQSRLFERFYRIDEARSRDVGGTGIGLSLVKHIMIRHGGSVRVESEPGQGAEFICHFPGDRHSR